MSTFDVIAEMSDGNPGGLTVMMMLLEKTESIDPDAALGGIGSILSLDTHGIYGSRIWMFYKDVCGQNINKMLGLMRAVQLGYLTDNKLNHAIDNMGDGIDAPELLKQVKEYLPAFVM